MDVRRTDTSPSLPPTSTSTSASSSNTTNTERWWRRSWYYASFVIFFTAVSIYTTTAAITNDAATTREVSSMTVIPNRNGNHRNVTIATTKITTVTTTTTNTMKADLVVFGGKNASLNDNDNDDNNDIDLSDNDKSGVNIQKINHINDDPTIELPPITFLVQLSGEFGNNLQKIIRGWGTAKLAHEEFGIKTHIVYAEQQVPRKAKPTTKYIKRCFISPRFNGADFELGHRLLSQEYFYELDAILIPNQFSLSDDKATIHGIRDNLKKLSNYLHENPQIHHQRQSNDLNTNIINEGEGYNSTMTASTSTGISIPKFMVRVSSLREVPIIDEFYDLIRDTFIFDDAHCCGATLNAPPQKDESVFHYRNFATEMKLSTRVKLGFEELDPKRLAWEVFRNLKPGDKIAITGRNLEIGSKRNNTEPYKLLHALKGRNLTVRFSPGSDAMEDFCFLKSAKKELVGAYKSSYVKLAAYFGGPSIIVSRLYQYTTRQVLKSNVSLNLHKQLWGNWTNPELASRIKFEEYF